MSNLIDKFEKQVDKVCTKLEKWWEESSRESPAYDPFGVAKRERRKKKRKEREKKYIVGSLLKRKEDGKIFRINKYHKYGLELEREGCSEDRDPFLFFTVRWSKIEKEYEPIT